MDVVLTDSDGAWVNTIVVETLAEAQAAFPQYTCTERVAEASPPPAVRIITKLEFRRRFTLTERIALDAAPTNAALDATLRATLFTMTKDLELAESINLDDPDVVAGLALIESAGLIAAGRAAAISA